MATLRGLLKKLNSKVIDAMNIKEEIIELAEEKIEEIESKADDRDSGELTEREEEKIDEIKDLVGTLEDDGDLDSIEG